MGDTHMAERATDEWPSRVCCRLHPLPQARSRRAEAFLSADTNECQLAEEVVKLMPHSDFNRENGMRGVNSTAWALAFFSHRDFRRGLLSCRDFRRGWDVPVEARGVGLALRSARALWIHRVSSLCWGRERQ